jgi:hypothetical protein
VLGFAQFKNNINRQPSRLVKLCPSKIRDGGVTLGTCCEAQACRSLVSRRGEFFFDTQVDQCGVRFSLHALSSRKEGKKKPGDSGCQGLGNPSPRFSFPYLQQWLGEVLLTMPE